MDRADRPLTPADLAAGLAAVGDLHPAPSPPRLDEVVAAVGALGAGPGEVVLVQAANGAALLHQFFGVLLAGGVPALLGPTTPRTRVRELAERLGARVLLTECRPGPGARPLGAGAAEELAGIVPTVHEPDHVVLLTSGTSGASSGCLHSFAALARNATRHAAAVGLERRDTVLVTLPLHFSYALVAQALAALAVGARLLVAAPPFTTAAYAAALTERQVSSSSLTPFLVRRLVEDDWKPPESLRTLTVGGAPLGPADTAELLYRGPGLELYVTYGLTEAGPRVCTLAAHDEPPEHLDSVGFPLPGVELSLRGAGPDGVGEVLVRSDTVLRRRVGLVDEGGRGDLLAPDLIATGDLGSVDSDGRLRLAGRIGEFLTISGSKVSLPSVRRIAEALPGVTGAVTRPVRDGSGEPAFELDLYLSDVDAPAARATRTALMRRLLPAERPGRLRMLPADGMRHK